MCPEFTEGVHVICKTFGQGKCLNYVKHSISEKLSHSLKHSFARPLSPCSASVPCTTSEAAVLWGVMPGLQAASSLTLPPFEFSAVL